MSQQHLPSALELSKGEKQVEGSTSTHLKRQLHVIESLQPARGVGFLCGVVHAQVYALCKNGASSKLHIVLNSNLFVVSILHFTLSSREKLGLLHR